MINILILSALGLNAIIMYNIYRVQSKAYLLQLEIHNANVSKELAIKKQKEAKELAKKQAEEAEEAAELARIEAEEVAELARIEAERIKIEKVEKWYKVYCVDNPNDSYYRKYQLVFNTLKRLNQLELIDEKGNNRREYDVGISTTYNF